MGIDPAKVEPDDIHSFNRYAYAINNPYKYVDPDGKKVVISGSKSFQKQAQSAINQIKSKPSGKALYDSLNNSSKVHTITQSSSGNSVIPDKGYKPGTGTGSTIRFDPSSMHGGVDATGSTSRPPFVGLGHEMGHSEAIDQGTQVFGRGSGKKGTTPPRENNSMKRENQIRNEHKLPARPSYY